MRAKYYDNLNLFISKRFQNPDLLKLHLKLKSWPQTRSIQADPANLKICSVLTMHFHTMDTLNNRRWTEKCVQTK